MKCLLDTATFLWMIFGEEARLSKRALRIVQESEEIHLSAVSVWEIVIKYGIGKLSLKAHPKTWLPEIVLEMGLKSLPISQRHVLEVAELKDVHRDPFDRLLIAQAVVEGLPILTPDKIFKKYSVATLW